MSKNNFFVKFAFFYIRNFKDMADDASSLWDAIKYLMEPLITIIFFPLKIIKRILFAIIPILQIYLTTQVVYVTHEELVELELRHRKEPGYFFKKKVAKHKRAIAENTDEKGG